MNQSLDLAWYDRDVEDFDEETDEDEEFGDESDPTNSLSKRLSRLSLKKNTIPHPLSFHSISHRRPSSESMD
jgi:hypothetical protein